MIPPARIIPSILADLIRPAPLCDEKVDFAWRNAVGAPVAKVTSVKLQCDNALRVKVQDANWHRELARQSGLILARLEVLLGSGVVTRLDFTT